MATSPLNFIQFQWLVSKIYIYFIGICMFEAETYMNYDYRAREVNLISFARNTYKTTLHLRGLLLSKMKLEILTPLTPLHSPSSCLLFSLRVSLSLHFLLPSEFT